MKGICMRYATSEMEADDILQESFIKVFRNLDQYKDQGSLGGWIRTITVNTAIQFYRKRTLLNQHLNDLALEAEVQGSIEPFDTIDLDTLRSKIQELPDGYRLVFNLYAVEGYNHKEIGELLEISEGTSKSQFSRAKKILQKMVNELYPNDNLIERYVN